MQLWRGVIVCDIYDSLYTSISKKVLWKSNDRNLQRSVPMIIMTIMANHYIRIAVQNFLLTFPKVTDHEFPHSSMTWISEVRSVITFFSCSSSRSFQLHLHCITNIFMAIQITTSVSDCFEKDKIRRSA